MTTTENNNAPTDSRDTLRKTRVTLVHKLHDLEDDQSWTRFYDDYAGLIFSCARKMGLSESESDEALQTTMIKIARHIPSFVYDPQKGSFKAWLMRIAKNVIIDGFRLRKAYMVSENELEALQGDDSRMTAYLERVSGGNNMEDVWKKEWQKHVHDAAVDRVKQRVDPKHFQIYECLTVQEWTYEDAAQFFGKKANHVGVIKTRISEEIQEEARKLLAEEPA